MLKIRICISHCEEKNVSLTISMRISNFFNRYFMQKSDTITETIIFITTKPLMHIR